ncbi:MAG: sensor histidine kinase [Elainella sp.]
MATTAILEEPNHLALRRMQLELQQAKAEALKALEQEQELNRLQTEFVSMISHDFRTPLTSIQGFAELLHYGDHAITLETRERYFEKINASVEHLLFLLDEVLLIGSVEAGKTIYQPVSTNLEAFCRDLCESLQLGQENHPVIQISYIGRPTGKIDKVLLNRILINLLSNAVKYSDQKSKILFNICCEQDSVTFQIKDEGIGIPQESLQHLFKTFYRCSNVGQIKGSGLGLAVVKKCVEVYRGEIHLDSQEGVGTTVTVRLPFLQ